MSQEPNISNFLSGKPSIEPVAQSALLSRLRTFLPQMEEANRNMPEEQSADAFHIEKNVVKEEESSDDSSDSEDEEDNVVMVEGKIREEGEGIEEEEKKLPDSIEIDLDVFREHNSTVDSRDVSVQSVDTLPAAFQAGNEQEQKEKKPLIEEI